MLAILETAKAPFFAFLLLQCLLTLPFRSKVARWVPLILWAFLAAMFVAGVFFGDTMFHDDFYLGVLSIMRSALPAFVAALVAGLVGIGCGWLICRFIWKKRDVS